MVCAMDGQVERQLPNFLVLGTAKAGTSSLYVYLKQHPDVYLSPTTEPNFFAHEGRDLNFRGPGDLKYIWDDSLVATYEDYCKQFAGVDRERAIGEVSTHNLYDAQAPALIKRYLPNVKMIAMLRQPAERAFSAFAHMVRDGREETRDFRAALAREQARIRDNWEPLWHYKSMGFYGAQLSRFYEIFNRNQIRAYIYDDFVARPLEIMQDIFDFIGVDPTFAPEMSEKYNVSTMARSRQLHEMMMNKSPVRSALRSMVPARARSRIRSFILTRNGKRLRLAPDERCELMNVYREDIGLLERLVDRDLSHWLKAIAG
jgi:Sulfotransferase family